MRRRADAGFTLLEVLVAVAVLGMLLIMLNEGVAFGVRATGMQRREDDRQGDLVAVDRALRRLVAHTAPGVASEPASLSGGAGRIALVTDIPSPDESGLERVEAVLLVSGDALELRWTPRRHVAPIGPPPPAQRTPLLTGVRALAIDYFADGSWHADWSDKRLPALVRLKLEFVDARRQWPAIIVAPLQEPVEQ